MSKERLKIEFANRMCEAASDLGWTDTRVNSRVKNLMDALPFKVSQPATRDWYIGVAVPDATHIGYVANALKVNIIWLMTGKGRKQSSLFADNRGDLVELYNQASSSTKYAVNFLLSPPKEQKELAELLTGTIIAASNNAVVPGYQSVDNKQASTE